MRTTIFLSSLIVSCVSAAALVAACGGDSATIDGPGTDASTTDGPTLLDGSKPDTGGGVDAGNPDTGENPGLDVESNPRKVTCGSDLECSVDAGQRCCAVAAFPPLSCAASCPDASIGSSECDEAADCANGQVCCANPGTYKLQCQAGPCPTNGFQACKTTSECATCATYKCGVPQFPAFKVPVNACSKPSFGECQ